MKLKSSQCKSKTKNQNQCRKRQAIDGYCSQHFVARELDRRKNGTSDKDESDIEKKISNLLQKFHSVVSQLGQRYQNRNTIKISDTNDIIDVLSALLIIHFYEIEIKQYNSIKNPTNSPMFQPYILLKKKKVIIVVNMVKNQTEEQIQDLVSYYFNIFQDRSSCEVVYYFIYDPDGKIKAPEKFQERLLRKGENFVLKAIVSQ